MEFATNKNAKWNRLWLWLLGVALIAVFLGWFGYRHYCIQSEARLIAGVWAMVDNNGNTVTKPQGSSILITLDQFHVDPFAEPSTIDFQLSNGAISKAIYRWENGALRVLQSSEGLERPRSFADTIKDLRSVGTQSEHSLSEFRLSRPTN
jgi:uncharacterized protein (TIGR03067 family)